MQTAVGLGIPVPAMGSSLAYYDSYRSARLPANLTQAQRDFFGAHTYRRVDRDGVFHTELDRRRRCRAGERQTLMANDSGPLKIRPRAPSISSRSARSFTASIRA